MTRCPQLAEGGLEKLHYWPQLPLFGDTGFIVYDTRN